MSIRYGVRPVVMTLIVTLAAAACHRQAVVESEPNPGAQSGVGEDALTADLERLMVAQDEFEADNGYYAGRVEDLAFEPSPNVRIDIIQGDRDGWSATASSGGAECAAYEGSIRSPRSYLTESGVVMCRG